MAGKYTRTYVVNKGISRDERKRIHPIWRGVGCAMLILFPVIGVAGGQVLLDLNGQNNWMPIPRDLLMKKTDFLYSLIPDPMLYIKAIMFFVIVAVLFALFFLVSFILTSQLGITDRSDPYYVPPVKRARRRRV